MLASHLNDLNTPLHLESTTFFALPEVTEEILAGFLHVVVFTWKSRRVFVTTPAWEAAGGEVVRCKRKLNPLISEETFEIVRQRKLCSIRSKMKKGVKQRKNQKSFKKFTTFFKKKKTF